MGMALTSQFLRFGIVGLVSNAVLYGLYLVATSIGIQHTVAMTVVFAIGTAQTFVFNKRWSFAYHDAHGGGFLRYLLAYAIAYVINLSAMWILVDVEGYPHRIVQAVMVVVVALVLFFLQRFWVFRSPASSVRV
jgi:putative flippase GtrA